MSITEISKKVCVLGDSAVGKTSLVRRLVEGSFDDSYLSTIEVKTDRKVIQVPSEAGVTPITIILWDLVGGEKFNRTQANYLRGASGALLVCDLTRPVTLKSLSYYAAELWRLSPGVKLLLIGNKRDLVEEQPVMLSQIEAVAASLEAPFYLTSAKTGERVESVFQHLGRLLLP